MGVDSLYRKDGRKRCGVTIPRTQERRPANVSGAGAEVVREALRAAVYRLPFRKIITGAVSAMIRRSSNSDCVSMYSRSAATFFRTSSMQVS